MSAVRRGVERAGPEPALWMFRQGPDMESTSSQALGDVSGVDDVPLWERVVLEPLVVSWTIFCVALISDWSDRVVLALFVFGLPGQIWMIISDLARRPRARRDRE
jgi:hypothetical protein